MSASKKGMFLGCVLVVLASLGTIIIASNAAFGETVGTTAEYVKFYDSSTETIQVRKYESGLNVSLMNIQLLSNTDTCLTECEAEFMFQRQPGDIEKYSEQIFEYGEVEHEFMVYRPVDREIRTPIFSCENKCIEEKNGTVCSMEDCILTGWNSKIIQEMNWVRIGGLGELSSGIIHKIKMSGRKEIDENVDWILNFFGISDDYIIPTL